MNLKLGSLLGYLLAVVGAVYLVLKGYVLSDNIFAIIIQVLALGLMIWARITFGMRSFNPTANATKGKLITSGPYRLFRHPIYVSVIFFFTASLIYFPFIETVIAVLFIFIGLFVRMLLEEIALKETYKEEYEIYSKHTKRIIPFLF